MCVYVKSRSRLVATAAPIGFFIVFFFASKKKRSLEVLVDSRFSFFLVYSDNSLPSTYERCLCLLTVSAGA